MVHSDIHPCYYSRNRCEEGLVKTKRESAVIVRQQEVIRNAVAVLNGDRGEDARRGFLEFLRAQKRAEMLRADRATHTLTKLRNSSQGSSLTSYANKAAD